MKKLVGALAFTGLFVLFFAFGIPPASAQTSCTNPSPIPSGYAAPCPVLSLSSYSITASGPLSLTLAPNAASQYIWGTVYLYNGSSWVPLVVSSNYLTATTNYTIPASDLSSLSQGTYYIASWDWTWNQSQGCYVGPGSTTCSTGEWRVQEFSVTNQSQMGVNDYYVNGSIGSDSNDGLAATNGGGHGPWATIQHAVNSKNITLGTNGTTITVAAGTYSVPQMTTGEDPLCAWSGCSLYHVFIGVNGTPTQPVILQCAAQWQCIIQPSDNVVQEGIVDVGQNGQSLSATGGNYVQVVGFHIHGIASGANSSNYTQAGLEIDGDHSASIGNYIDHILKYTNDGAYGIYVGYNGTATGCVDACPVNSAPFHSGQRVIGNVIVNVGTPASCPSCLLSSVNIYAAAPNETIENNLLFNDPTVVISQSCITANHWGTNSIVSNNTLNCHDNGGSIDVHMGDSPFDDNVPLNEMTYDNNVVIDSAGNGYQFRESGAFSTPMYFGDNACDTATCFVNTAGSGPAIVGTLSGTVAGINPSTFFKGWNASNQYPSIVGGGTDYSLASPVAGTTACVSGGITPCTPSANILGATRGSTPDIGAF